MAALYALEQLLWRSLEDMAVAALLKQVEIVAIPVVNPDGGRGTPVGVVDGQSPGEAAGVIKGEGSLGC
eukprot:846437-Pyramimonas_sp.AAC.1